MSAIVPVAVVSERFQRQEVNDSADPLLTTLIPIATSQLPKDDAASHRVFDAQAALERVQGDRELLQNMIGIFATQWRERLTEITRAAECHDSAVVEIVANNLKQSLGSFAACKASRIAQELEEFGRNRSFDALGNKCDGLRIEIEHLVSALMEFSRETVPGRSQ
jgi:HPt (histidine-containing phosphotransfer) domain-containing protein